MTFLNSLECSRRYLFTSKCAARSIMVQRAPNLNNVDESYDFLKNWGVILAGTVHVQQKCSENVLCQISSAIYQLEGEIFPYCPFIIARAYSDAEVI